MSSICCDIDSVTATRITHSTTSSTVMPIIYTNSDACNLDFLKQQKISCYSVMPIMVNLIVLRRFATTSARWSRDLVTSRDSVGFSPPDVIAVTSQFDVIVTCWGISRKWVT